MGDYFNDKIYNDVQLLEFEYPTIEFTGYSQGSRLAQMENIFNKD
jgi:hypothetical protein